MNSSALDELVSGSRFKKYILIEKIGAGGQGVVWSALDSSASRLVALKLYEVLPDDTDQADDRIFERQAARLMGLAHPNVLPTLDIGLDGTVRYQATPYIPGDTLHDYLRFNKLTSAEVLHYAAAIADALDYLHANGVIHRDMKPGNVLLDVNGGVYLTDFGIARMVSQSTRVLHTGRGTPPYSPPEQHSRGEITPQSDIFSFGVILYELFTRQLPWDGERSLGLELIYSSKNRIPDPQEVDPNLPPELTQVLRRMTELTPQARYATAGEAFEQLCAAMGQAAPELRQRFMTSPFNPKMDAETMIANCLKFWDPELDVPAFSLTRFAFVANEYQHTASASIPANIRRFLLQHSLILGWQAESWWRQAERVEKLETSAILISGQDEEICARVLYSLLHDPTIRSDHEVSSRLTEALLRLVLKTRDPFLRQECFDTLDALLVSGDHWHDTILGGEMDSVLAKLATEESPQQEQAAGLIGRVRSRAAVESVIRRAESDPIRLKAVLFLILQSAGSLPAPIPIGTRLTLQWNWFLSRSLARPAALRTAYLQGFIGASLGFGTLVFLTFRLMEFMDTARFVVSIERGLQLGLLFPLGVIFARVIVERFPELPAGLRLLAGMTLGGAVLYLDFLLYSLFFLNNFPGGLMLGAACLVTALGFAAGGFFRSVLWKSLISLGTLTLALIGSWWLHVELLATGQFLSPLLFFEYSWPVSQVIATALGIALLPAVLGSLQDLTLSER